jgi:hypothetical protein
MCIVTVVFSVLVYGIITIGFAYLAPLLGSSLLLLSLNLLGVVGAPMLALFIMGVFMPFVNAVVSTYTGTWRILLAHYHLSSL